MGQQREDGSGYGSEAFGDGASDEETRAEVGLTIGKGRPCHDALKPTNALGGYCRDLPRIKLHFGTFLGPKSDNKGATFTYVTDFLHTKAITGHDADLNS